MELAQLDLREMKLGTALWSPMIQFAFRDAWGNSFDEDRLKWAHTQPTSTCMTWSSNGPRKWFIQRSLELLRNGRYTLLTPAAEIEEGQADPIIRTSVHEATITSEHRHRFQLSMSVPHQLLPVWMCRLSICIVQKLTQVRTARV